MRALIYISFTFGSAKVNHVSFCRFHYIHLKGDQMNSSLISEEDILTIMGVGR